MHTHKQISEYTGVTLTHEMQKRPCLELRSYTLDVHVGYINVIFIKYQ